MKISKEAKVFLLDAMKQDNSDLIYLNMQEEEDESISISLETVNRAEIEKEALENYIVKNFDGVDFLYSQEYAEIAEEVLALTVNEKGELELEVIYDGCDCDDECECEGDECCCKHNHGECEDDCCCEEKEKTTITVE